MINSFELQKDLENQIDNEEDILAILNAVYMAFQGKHFFNDLGLYGYAADLVAEISRKVENKLDGIKP